MMKAIIEKSSDGGYGIYAADDAIPVVSSGATEDEAKKEFEACKRTSRVYKRTGRCLSDMEGRTDRLSL